MEDNARTALLRRSGEFLDEIETLLGAQRDPKPSRAKPAISGSMHGHVAEHKGTMSLIDAVKEQKWPAIHALVKSADEEQLKIAENCAKGEADSTRKIHPEKSTEYDIIRNTLHREIEVRHRQRPQTLRAKVFNL